MESVSSRETIAEDRSTTTRSRSKSKLRDADYALSEQVGHLLRRAHQRHCGIFAEGMDSTLTPMQFAVLVTIDNTDGVSQNHLGRLVAMDPATTQGVVRRLQDRELIEAVADPSDRRRQIWHATGSGRRLLKKLLPKATEISEATLAPLSAAERKQFLKLLEKLA